jgi:hypothetical protein
MPWTAHPGEVRPDVKARAVRLVEGVGTWTGAAGRAQGERRARRLGATSEAAAALQTLLPAGQASVVRIVDAQYGGILATTASVLVVVDQWVQKADGSVHAGGTTFDIRLEAGSPRWRVVAVNPAKPGPRAAGLSRTARAVLADTRISLPYAARADVQAGRVHDSVLRAVRALAQDHAITISVLRSGHPLKVFGTSRDSDHPKGRAADIWAFDGLRVVEPRNQARVEAFMREASATGAYQVGGPVDLDGPGRAYFSDNTHQDHVHLGFLS